MSDFFLQMSLSLIYYIIWSNINFVLKECGNSLIYSFIFPSIYLSILSSISSVAQSCLTLCDPMDYSTPGFPVHHQLLELAQIKVHPTISSSIIVPFSSCLQSFPASGSFPMSQLFAAGG